MNADRYSYITYGLAQTFESESDMHEAITGWPLNTETLKFRGGRMRATYPSHLRAEIWATADSTRKRAYHQKLYRYIDRSETGR